MHSEGVDCTCLDNNKLNDIKQVQSYINGRSVFGPSISGPLAYGGVACVLVVTYVRCYYSMPINTYVSINKKQFRVIQIQYKPKLRAYITFKMNFVTEPYIHQSLSKSRRSLMTQLRLQIFPLEIDTGRCMPIFDTTIKTNIMSY